MAGRLDLRDKSKIISNYLDSIVFVNRELLLSMADFMKKVGSEYRKMEDDLANYKKSLSEIEIDSQKLARRISALQGVITKMKKSKLKP